MNPINIKSVHPWKGKDFLIPIKCEICNIGFQSLYEKSMHKLKCNQKLEVNKVGCENSNVPIVSKSQIPNIANCENCNKKFVKGQNLLRHLKNSSCIWPRVCFICSRHCGTFKTLYTHLDRKHLIKRLFKCTICNIDFAFEQQQVTHFIEKHQTRENIPEENYCFNCQGCNQSFVANTTSEVLFRHDTDCKKKKKESGNGFKCEFCGKTMRNSAVLQQHLNDHYGVRNYKCNICQKSFTKPSLLQLHLRKHTERVNMDREVDCDICGTGLTTKAHVRQHKRKVHLMGKENVECPDCRIIFASTKLFGVHDRTTCSKKKKEFLSRSNIDEEYILATYSSSDKASPLKDNPCPDTSSTSNDSPCHDDSSTSELYPCPYCHVMSTMADDMRYHVAEVEKVNVVDQSRLAAIMIFATEFAKQEDEDLMIDDDACKRYACFVCGKKYKDDALLSEHIKHFHVNYA